MNIIDRLKKWFFNEEKVGIINIGDIIQIPGRDYYKDDLAKLNQIDIYKEEYLNILSKRKLISSKEISFDNLEKEFLMHIELILNLYLNKEQDLNMTPETYINEKINMLKLQLYLNEINNMETETIEKLIALEELQKGKRVPIVNRSLLTEKINNLKIIILSFRNQRVAISIEIKNQLTLLNNNDMSCHIDHVHIVDKYQQIYDLAENVIPTSMLNSINNLKIDYMPKIALIEKELEIFAYLHKKDTEAIKKEISILKRIPITSLNQAQLLKSIEPIENKYYIFKEYGRGIITHDNLYELYKLKFDILTFDINYQEVSPVLMYSAKELKNYEEIILRKFERILTGKNEIINDIYGDTANKAIKEISFYLKGKNNFAHNILSDKLKLALLLAFDRKDGIVDFFNQNMINTEEANIKYSIDYDRDAFVFADRIPLDTCFQIMESQENAKKQYSITYDHPLYKLYKLTTNLPQFNIGSIYALPEGLVKINIPYIELNPKGLHEYINRKIQNNTVIFPSTLEEISGYVFEQKALNIVLNKGLKKIGKHTLSNQKTEHLFIPSSVELIEEGALNYKSIKWLYFTDFENSKLLHDKSALRKLIKELFYVAPIGVNPKHEEVYDGIYREYILLGINTTLKDINLYNDKGKQILVINTDRLIINKKRFRSPNKIKNRPFTYGQTIKWNDPFELNTLSLEDINDIIARLQTIIKEEIGYDLEYTTHKEKAKKIIKK